MSVGGSCKAMVTAEDVASLKGEFMQLTVRAGLAAGYVMDVRNIRYENLVYANGKHFHPFSNWEQCVRLIVDTGSKFEICGVEGSVEISSQWGPFPGEVRRPVSDAEYRLQMCDAVVRNVAKGFPV